MMGVHSMGQAHNSIFQGKWGGIVGALTNHYFTNIAAYDAGWVQEMAPNAADGQEIYQYTNSSGAFNLVLDMALAWDLQSGNKIVIPLSFAALLQDSFDI